MARKTRVPTTARPAMTPPLSSLLVDVGLVEFVPEAKSIANCWTHSPNLQPVRERPSFPKSPFSVDCWKKHAPLVEFAQLMSSSPSRLLMI